MQDIDENDDCSFDNLDADVNQVNAQYNTKITKIAKITNHDQITTTNTPDNKFTTQKQQQKDQQKQTDSEHDPPTTMMTEAKMENHAQKTPRITKNFSNFVKKTTNNKNDNDKSINNSNFHGNELQLDVDLDMVIILSPSDKDESSSTTTIVGEEEEEENAVNNNIDNCNVKSESAVNSQGLQMKRIESESYSQQTTNTPKGTDKSADHDNQFYLHNEPSISTKTNKKQSIFGSFCAAFCCC